MSNADKNGLCIDCGSRLSWNDANQDFLCHNVNCPSYGAYGFPEDDYSDIGIY